MGLAKLLNVEFHGSCSLILLARLSKSQNTDLLQYLCNIHSLLRSSKNYFNNKGFYLLRLFNSSHKILLSLKMLRYIIYSIKQRKHVNLPGSIIFFPLSFENDTVTSCFPWLTWGFRLWKEKNNNNLKNL